MRAGKKTKKAKEAHENPTDNSGGKSEAERDKNKSKTSGRRKKEEKSRLCQAIFG